MIKAFRLTIALALVILVLSVMSVPKLPKLEVKAADKIGHLTAYFALAFTLFFELAKKFRWSNTYRRWLIHAVIICITYGVLMELLQATPLFNRHFDYYDMIANTVGVALGLAVFALSSKWLKRFYIK